MKDIYAVIRQKLDELNRCRIDVHCLKVTIRLLREIPDVRADFDAGRISEEQARNELGLPSIPAEEENVL